MYVRLPFLCVYCNIIQFLFQVMNSGLMKNEHLQCTNLHHFEAMVSCALQEKECSSILETLTVQLDNGSSKRICVDIVSENGHKWTKVIARNAAALSRISVGTDILFHHINFQVFEKRELVYM